MRFRDILGLAFEALAQQKLRTALTSLGVISGSFVLAASLSLREGVQETILREISRFGDLRRVEVMPGYGEERAGHQVPQIQGDMSTERRARLQAEMQRRFRPQVQPFPSIPLTSARLQQLERLPHVRSLALDSLLIVHAKLAETAKAKPAQLASARADDEFLNRLIVGRYFSSDDSQEVLVT